jgi:hypothetical protein
LASSFPPEVNDELKPSLELSGYSVQAGLTGTVTGFRVGLDNINAEVEINLPKQTIRANIFFMKMASGR